MTDAERVEQARLMMEWKPGEPLEFRSVDLEKWVLLAEAPEWNFTEYRYRRPPKPLEFWINVYPDGGRACHADLHSAIENAGDNCVRKAVHVREVVE